MTADQFIKLCVFLGHDQDEIIREVQQEPFSLNGHLAKAKVLAAVRSRQEVSIADEFEDIIEEVRP